MRVIEIGNIKVGGSNPIVLFGGPCAIENEVHLLAVGKRIKKITTKLNIPYILKASFDKANRTSIDSYRGPGLTKGLEILSHVKDELDVPIMCDVHELNQVEEMAKVVDVIQIPAFLSRQTDLICAVAKTGKTVNIKKGQFLAPWDMKGVVEKVEQCGNHNIILTERGVSFGYNNLVSDMRSLVIMKTLGYPIMFDATHSVQLPGGLENRSGGQREFVPYLARAATAVGIDAIFMEIHDNPDNAPCDGPNMIEIDTLPELLAEIKAIDALVRGR